jgi:hypothetical protein
MKKASVGAGFGVVGNNPPRERRDILAELANPRPLHDGKQTLFNMSTQLADELSSILSREWWCLRHPEMGWIAVFVKKEKQ